MYLCFPMQLLLSLVTTHWVLPFTFSVLGLNQKLINFFFRSKILGGLGGIPSSNFIPENLSKIFLIILEIKTIFSI